MISIKLKNISIEKIEQIASFAKNIGNKNPDDNYSAESNTDEAVEAIIENYLLSCNNSKVELTQCMVNLTKQEIIELLALYYFFSKLTYDNTILSDEELYEFWELCNLNSTSDIDRLGLDTMVNYLKEKYNLEAILATAVINLKA